MFLPFFLFSTIFVQPLVPIPNSGPRQYAHGRGSENRDEGDESDANDFPRERASCPLAGRWQQSLGCDYGEPSCRVQRVKCEQFWIQQHERHQFARSTRTTPVTSTTASSSSSAAKVTPTDYTASSNVSTPSSSTRAPPAVASAFWTAFAPLPPTQPAPAIGVYQ